MTTWMASTCLFALLLAGGAAFAADAPAPATPVERGSYLVTLGGCHDCHSPKKMTPQGPVPDETRLLSGNPAGEPLPPVPNGLIAPEKWGALTNNHFSGWAGPWGISYAANLSPDPLTGTGRWTEELFLKAVRTGKLMGSGRPILPPMPWQEYATMNDADLKAIFAYLRSIKPVRNQVPAAVPSAVRRK